MSLRSISYSEYEGDPRQWTLERVDFGDVNLLVGRNSTGKTRVLNVLASIARLLSGKQGRPFGSGKFDLEVDIKNQVFSYSITCHNGGVSEERLSVDGQVRLIRDAQGDGKVYYASEGRDIAFKIDPQTIAVQNKKDQLQHPFIHDLSQWADGVARYAFGSDFGRSMLMQHPGDLIGSSPVPVSDDNENTVGVYVNAFARFSHEFDQAIIRDMAKLGYNLHEVCAEPLANVGVGGIPPNLLGLVTVEQDLGSLRNPQTSMSQGMFRALALVIHLNLAIFSHEKSLLLIDDIGEGLDYGRATAIIDLIISAAEQNNIQVLMTSNDRFVMNRIPLDYWVVLQRTGSHVRAFTPKNSPKEFEDFKFVGLSNFDFFTDVNFH